MSETLIDPTYLFRFSLALPQHPLRFGEAGLELPEHCRVPSFGALADRPVYADVRMAWDESGLGFSVHATGKRQLPWCRDSRIEDSDGLHLWIDTRNSPGIHRANRYCHRFALLPLGGGSRRQEPLAALLPINRARQSPNPIPAGTLQVFGKLVDDGYRISGRLPAASLTGFDPGQYPEMSLWYAVVDRERGWQTLSLGPEYPVDEDPSLWASVNLVAK